MTNKLETTIQRLVGSKSDEEAKKVYAEWQSYDTDLDEYGYVAPQLAAEKLINAVNNTNAHIYDAGCGTGKVGAVLHSVGYKHLQGGDFSESMLQRAQSLNIYEKLSTADFTQPLDYVDNYFDAAISVGVWKDHFGPVFTEELVRIVKTGGFIALTVRPQFMPAFNPIAETLESSGTAQIVCNETGDYIKGQQSTAHYIVIQKNS